MDQEHWLVRRGSKARLEFLQSHRWSAGVRGKLVLLSISVTPIHLPRSPWSTPRYLLDVLRARLGTTTWSWSVNVSKYSQRGWWGWTVLQGIIAVARSSRCTAWAWLHVTAFWCFACSQPNSFSKRTSSPTPGSCASPGYNHWSS